jgi:hypothetical protein
VASEAKLTATLDVAVRAALNMQPGFAFAQVSASGITFASCVRAHLLALVTLTSPLAQKIALIRRLLAAPGMPWQASTLGVCVCELLEGASSDEAMPRAPRSPSIYSTPLSADDIAHAHASRGSAHLPTIDDFKILKVIARGGYGTVSLASKKVRVSR